MEAILDRDNNLSKLDTEINMRTNKSIIDYQDIKRESGLTQIIDENHNGNPNKSFQPTETAVFETVRFNLFNQSTANPTFS